MSNPGVDKFTQLVEDLISEELTMTQIQLAIREYVRRHPKVPEYTKDILCGGPLSPGLIKLMFNPISQVIGAMELIDLRMRPWREERWTVS